MNVAIARWLRPARLTLAALAFTSLALAQTPPTPLQRAVNALNVSHPLPPGWTVKQGHAGGAMGNTDPKTKTITIDPEAITTQFPSVDPEEANKPGVIYIVLLHEWYHAQECEGGSAGAGGGGSPPYNTDPRGCGDVQLIPGVAAQHCQLIAAVASVGGNTGPLCDFYKALRDNYNKGKDGKGGAKKFMQANCPGATYPGDIPACEACN